MDLDVAVSCAGKMEAVTIDKVTKENARTGDLDVFIPGKEAQLSLARISLKLFENILNTVVSFEKPFLRVSYCYYVSIEKRLSSLLI